MAKYYIIFLIGLIEQILYTSYIISVQKRCLYYSTLFMFIYMCLYLGIVAYAISEQNWILLGIYAFSCAVGNYFTVYLEKKKNEKTN